MNVLKLRRTLIKIHLYLAGFLAPAFIIVALSGGLDLAGMKAKAERTPLNIPGLEEIDFQSDTLQSDIEALLDVAGININIEYVRPRANMVMTRPSSRTYVFIERTPDGVEATLNKPNLQYSLMELHKGHGPLIFRYYQIVAAIALFLVVIGGLAVGVLAPAYRMPTIVSAIIGTLACAALAIF